MTPSRPWWLALFITAGALALVSLVVILFAGPLRSQPGAAILGFSAAIDGLAVFPGMVLSLVVNGLILWRRRPPVTRRADRRILTAVWIILAVVIVEGIAESITELAGVDQFGFVLFAAIPLWVALIVVSVIAAIVLAVGNSFAEMIAADALVEDAATTFGPVAGAGEKP